MPDTRQLWDFGTAVEALAAGQAAVWSWDPANDRLSFIGATATLGLGVLGSASTAAALATVAHPHDRAEVDALFRRRRPGEAVRASIRLRSGTRLAWTGAWTEEGAARLSGAVTREVGPAAVETDALTGLLDRRSFLIRARERLVEPGDYSVIVADLDRLRRLNEALGHERADLVLASLGSRLSAAFTGEALPARIGEDEFAVLVRRGDGSGPDKLRQALEAPLRVAGFDILPTLAVGAVDALGGPEAPDVAELLRRAELAVEQAKSGGRGGEAEYERGLETDQLSRLALEADLRRSLVRDEIEPFYQPIVRLSDGRIAGFEALMRWRHSRRGLLPPDDFIALAEELGLLPEFGRWMIAAVARQLATWRRDHPRSDPIKISVNLSPDELERDGLVEHVAEQIRRNGLPPRALTLEITESQIMKDPEHAADVLRGLREAGAGLSLDDFGTGFSSLSYLSRLPFDALKIDRYFVRTMATHEGSAKIVRSVSALGRDLNLEVVAEGVESRLMAERLQEVGCAYGQGYGYAPALPAREAEVYLAESYLDGVAPLKARA